MQKLPHSLPYVYSASIFAICYLIAYPYYQYLFDGDSTGYLNVAEKISKGELYNSINGTWSPLNAWLIVPFLKMGYHGIVAAKIVNGLLGIVSTLLCVRLIIALQFKGYIKWGILIGAIILLLHFAYSELCGDFLMLTTMLAYLVIIIRADLFLKKSLILTASLIAAIGFYAKGFPLYFCMLHMAILAIGLYKLKKYSRSFLLKKYLLFFIALIMLCLPWFITLYTKFGIIFPGQKNISGTLLEMSAPITNLIIPPLPGNSAFFDDITNMRTYDVTPFTSFFFFKTQVKIYLTNILVLVMSLNEFSIFFLSILALAIFYLFQRRYPLEHAFNHFILISLIMIWCGGYLFFSIQSRFLWIIDIAALFLAGIILQSSLTKIVLSASLRRWAFIVVMTSFIVFPLYELYKTAGQGKERFEIAGKLRDKRIAGKILTNNPDYSNAIELNYLLKTKYYGLNPWATNYANTDLIAEINRYRIDHFFYYLRNEIDKENILKSELVKQAGNVDFSTVPGVIILSFNHPYPPESFYKNCQRHHPLIRNTTSHFL